MSRRSLRPQLNQIRGWVRQGRTDAWIAHQLEVTVQQIQAFKREQGLEPDFEENGGAPEEVDLRAEDDAQIAAELEAEAARKAEEEARAAEEAARKAAEEEAAAAAAAAAAEAEEDGEAQACATAPRWAFASPLRARGPARRHVRPRRRGVRPLAGPRRAGRSRVRRALGGPPSRRDHDRGRPDRDPPCRRRRGRRRRLIRDAPPRSRGGARRIPCSARWPCRGRTARSCSPRPPRTSGTRISCASRATGPIWNLTPSCRPPTRCCATPATASSRSRTRSPAHGCGRSSTPPAGSPTATR